LQGSASLDTKYAERRKKMAIRYVDSNTIMDLGEKIRFKSKVEPVCGVDIPFSIFSANYELIFVDTDADTETVEDSGNCNINEHTLDALIEPQKTGIYCLRFIYKIADETWVDNYKIKVKG
jgi:hypothetical protein